MILANFAYPPEKVYPTLRGCIICVLLHRDEIRAAFTGKQVHGRALTPVGTYESDQGRWQVTDEHLFCDQWARWQEASDCDRIYLRGRDVVFVNRDGSKSGEGTIE